MEELISKLRKYTLQVIQSDIDIAERVIIENPMMRALELLEYADRLIKENNIKLGD